MTLSAGRVEVRMRARFRCGECGREYHPRVHAHAGRVIVLGLAAIVIVVGAGVLWYRGQVSRWWFLWAKVAAAVAVAILAGMAARLQRRLMEPAFHRPASSRGPAYGEIVLECPRCGSDSVESVL